jgi:hypothetical protein
MTITIRTGVCAAILGLTTAAMGQTTSSQQTTTQENTPSVSREITVTGCLKEAPATTTGTVPSGTASTAGTTGTTAAAGTAGTTGDTAAAAQKFVLTNATVSSGDTSGTTGTTGTTPAGAASASADAQTYRLIANPAALSPHVGKKLELTGTLEDQKTASVMSEPSAGSEAKTPALRVTAGKIVAASCSE